MNKQKLLIGIVVLSVLLFAALVGTRVQQKKVRTQALKQQVPPPVAVAVRSPRQGRMADSLRLSGQVVAEQQVELVPKASGRLARLWVQEGSPIKAGQLLAEIEHLELDAQILQAQASIEAARANLKQLRNGPLQTQIAQARASVRQLEALLKQLQTTQTQHERDYLRQQALAAEGVVTAQQLEMSRTQMTAAQQQILAMEQQIAGARASLQMLLDGTRPEQIAAAQAQVHQAEATLSLYRAQLQNYYLYAPLTGVITQKRLDPGNMVGPSSPILSLARTSVPEIEIFLPEREREKVQPGQRVNVYRSGQNPLVATVHRVSPVVDAQTRLVKLTVRPEGGSGLVAGGIVECELVLKEQMRTLVVPVEAVVRQQNQTLVYLVKDQKVSARSVLTGLRTPEEIEIRQGLRPTDAVIVRGTQFVQPGDRVQVQPAVAEDLQHHGS
jgi:HlyD family secretion protein